MSLTMRFRGGPFDGEELRSDTADPVTGRLMRGWADGFRLIGIGCEISRFATNPVNQEHTYRGVEVRRDGVDEVFVWEFVRSEPFED